MRTHFNMESKPAGAARLHEAAGNPRISVRAGFQRMAGCRSFEAVRRWRRRHSQRSVDAYVVDQTKRWA